jgi:dolichyl-phosphate-mannose-protein mannosyltransferase
MAPSKPSLNVPPSFPLGSLNRLPHPGRRYRVIVCAAVFVVLAIIRVVATYPDTAQAYDEPCHVAAGIEFLDRGTYVLDPVHPPLSRIFIGLPLYLAGQRYPRSGPGATSSNYNVVGNSILYDSGHYLRNLTLARLGVLPFLLLAAAAVFFWARREYGEFPALMAVALFTTLPIILAFSGIAYTDMAAASTQVTALFAFSLWIEDRTVRSTVLLGVIGGLALLAKATTMIFLPASALAIVAVKTLLDVRKNPAQVRLPRRRTAKPMAVALVIACVVVWAGYRFSVGHVDEAFNLSARNMPSFQHFPAPLRSVARRLVLSRPAVPAPALMRGFAEAWVLNKSAPQSYLLGKTKAGGWWYFFLVGIAVKTPLPFLILLLIGLITLTRDRARWTALAPAASAFAVLAVTMPVTYNAGVRHVLIVFPLFAMVAGYGSAALWRTRGAWQVPLRGLLVLLVLWQAANSFVARHDYIAYFNDLAGHDPSRILVAGCDLDCGQDVFRLAQALRERHVQHASIAVWSSAEMSRMGLSEYDVPQPFQPATGWVAVSKRAVRMGDVFHNSYPRGAFDWLSRFQPVATVGKTILLYDIPSEPAAASKR